MRVLRRDVGIVRPGRARQQVSQAEPRLRLAALDPLNPFHNSEGLNPCGHPYVTEDTLQSFTTRATLIFQVDHDLNEAAILLCTFSQ